MLWLNAAQTPHLVKHNRLVAIQKHPPVRVPLDGRGQHLALNVGPLLGQLLGAHDVVDAGHALLDDGALVEVGRDKVRGGANDLDAALVGLVVRLGTFKGRQERVVDVDDAPAHGAAQHRREHLHVPREHHELDVVLPDELEDLRLLLRLGVLGHGQVQERNVVALGESGKLGVVGDDERDLGSVSLLVSPCRDDRNLIWIGVVISVCVCVYLNLQLTSLHAEE